MAVVYSTRFVGAHATVGTLTYTVPAGFVAVLRDVDAFAVTGASADDLDIVGAGGQVIARMTFPPAAATNQEWRGRQVFQPGETMGFSVSVGPIDISASGYLLAQP